MIEDNDGTYLASLLYKNYSSIKIETGDGKWSSHFYLPSRKKLHNAENRFVQFTSSSAYSSTVYYSGEQKVLKRGYTFVFKYIKGVWCITRKSKAKVCIFNIKK